MWDNVKTRSLCLANPRLALLNKLMGDSQARRVPLSFTCFNLPDAFDFYYSKQQMTKVNSSWFRYIHHMDVYIYIYIYPEPPSKSIAYAWCKNRLSPLFVGGPIALQHLVQISTKYYNNAAKLRFIKISKKLLFIKISKIGFIKDFNFLKKSLFLFFARICRVLFLLLGWYFRKNANGIK